MPKKVDHDARRDELARAAWSVIAARGIDEVTLRDIARESGYSSGVLAHYFENKDDLLAHALRLSHRQILERYEEEVQAPPADALRAVLLDNLPLEEQRELETRIEMNFWARALRNAELKKLQGRESEALRALIRGLVEDARAAGAISAGHDSELILDLLGALVDGISLHALLYPERLPPQRQAQLMEFALELLGSPAGPSSPQ